MSPTMTDTLIEHTCDDCGEEIVRPGAVSLCWPCRADRLAAMEAEFGPLADDEEEQSDDDF